MRWLRRFCATALVAAAAVTAGVAAAAIDEVHWTVMGQTAVSFDWRGPDSTIQFGTSTAYGRAVTGATPSPLPFSSAGPFWEAKLTGLTENTLYHYSIAGGPDHTFRTPPPRGSSGFTVYVEGDIGETSSYPRMGDVARFIVFGTDSQAARMLSKSETRALLPPDIGLLLHGRHLVLDFSARPFDGIELGRMVALADQLVQHLPAG